MSRSFLAIAARHPRVRPASLDRARLVAALVSFVDDYDGPFPEEHFDDANACRILEALAESSRTHTIPDLLATAPCSDAPSFVEGVLLLHAALRQLARGRDGRALPSCTMSLATRLRIDAKIAPFAPSLSRGGDPLGDAYHYLANVAVGASVVVSRPETWWPAPLFACGPELMWLVRQTMFGSPLFFGNHARIDRLGLLHGLAVAGRAQTSSPV